MIAVASADPTVDVIELRGVRMPQANTTTADALISTPTPATRPTAAKG